MSPANKHKRLNLKKLKISIKTSFHGSFFKLISGIYIFLELSFFMHTIQWSMHKLSKQAYIMLNTIQLKHYILLNKRPGVIASCKWTWNLAVFFLNWLTSYIATKSLTFILFQLSHRKKWNLLKKPHRNTLSQMLCKQVLCKTMLIHWKVNV